MSARRTLTWASRRDSQLFGCAGIDVDLAIMAGGGEDRRTLLIAPAKRPTVPGVAADIRLAHVVQAVKTRCITIFSGRDGTMLA
jgi:hypothetical protein